MQNADLPTSAIIGGLETMDHLKQPVQFSHIEGKTIVTTKLARLRIIDLQAACQQALDFYNMDTKLFVEKYGAGMSTRDLGDKFREVLGLEART